MCYWNVIATDQPITFYLAPVINGTPRQDLQMLAYQINVKWLSVSFEDLVKALTCPDFDLDELDKEVAWTVLADSRTAMKRCMEK